MSRLLLVSNRVLSMKKTAQAGGAAVAIADVLNSRGGLWFGWSGKISDDLPEHIDVDPNVRACVVTTPLTSEEHASYYLGYSNAVLWPVFHGRINLAEFDAGHFQRYVEVNRRLARLLAPHIAPDDRIWVHDYQLIPFAAELRRLGITNPIGFFLHIPFPPAQTFQAIPEHRALAQALMAYDLIGLQTQLDVTNLRTYLQRLHHAQMLDDSHVRAGDRTITIESFPVGINPAEFAPELAVPAASAATGCARAVGVDRLDYTKGLPHKLRAFDRFLTQNPRFKRQVVLTQIAPPTREKLQAYEEVRSELAGLCGSVNGRHGELEWAPIHYLNRAIARQRLIGIYRSSRLCLVTPLNDGMNLVAKEYVAAQDPSDPGVLILSQFAGAAEELREAIIVNPYDIQEMADAIATGFEMPLEERKARHAALLARIRTNDANAWCRNFLRHLELVRTRTAPQRSKRLQAQAAQTAATRPAARRSPGIEPIPPIDGGGGSKRPLATGNGKTPAPPGATDRS